MPLAESGLSGLEWFGLISNAIALVVGLLAIWLSWQFYTQTNNTERQVALSLAKIEAQTKALQTLSGRWLDKLTTYVTTDRVSPAESAVSEIANALSQIPQVLLAQIRVPAQDQSNDELIDELLTCYIALYFYTALANFFTQSDLAEKEAFDPTNNYDLLVKRIIDSSHLDFERVANILARADQSRVERAPNAATMRETRDMWRYLVRSANEVYAERENRAQNSE